MAQRGSTRAAAPPNACETNYLLELAWHLDDQGFQSDADLIRGYVRDPRERQGWRSAAELLGALRRDVWWHYGQVGEEEERSIYEEAERTIARFTDRVIRCRTGRPGLGARGRR